ncbi:hypothetical protein, partial [Priestia megaterium]|uniref:hypothetical protein n=1 Tax=Priestia megaterium TaxID=1404 RepID=UPI002FFF6E3B
PLADHLAVDMGILIQTDLSNEGLRFYFLVLSIFITICKNRKHELIFVFYHFIIINETNEY